MKKYLVLLISSLIILVACEHEKPTKEYTSQKIDKKVDNKKKDNNKNQTENSSSNQSITQNFQLNQDKSQFVNNKQPENQFNHAQYINGKQGQYHNEWYQAPGNGDAIGYITPDGTQCTVGRSVSPSQQKVTRKLTIMSITKYTELKKSKKLMNNGFKIKSIGRNNIKINIYCIYF